MIIISNYVIAAICGNFWQESTVNPGIWEGLDPTGAGYGLGQWTDNAQVHRRTDLFNWLDARGIAHDSGVGQLQFLLDENLWLRVGAGGHVSAYNTLTEFLQSDSQNMMDLVTEFMWHWEGISDGTEAQRYVFALTVVGDFTHDDGVRDPWYTGNFFLTETQARMNSKHIKDFFSGSGELTDAEIMAIVSAALKRRRKGGGIIVF